MVCVHCVFSSPLPPAPPPPQSLRWWVTPHNFTAVFVCKRSCRWIGANLAACDARRGTKDDTRHASPLRGYVSAFRNFPGREEPCRVCARLLVTQSADPTHLRHFSPGDHEIIHVSYFPQMEKNSSLPTMQALSNPVVNHLVVILELMEALFIETLGI